MPHSRLSFVAALERSESVAAARTDHVFAPLKRGYFASFATLV
jgi:hypothetical protein